MLREKIKDSLQEAQRQQDQKSVSTLRLIVAAIKDRDIADRAKGNDEGISEQDILAMLQTMIKQRQESMKLYEQGGRLDLVDQEEQEIKIIQNFLPVQLTAEEVEAIVEDLIHELGAQSIKDMGSVMTAIRDRYAGKMDMAVASKTVKNKLS